LCPPSSKLNKGLDKGEGGVKKPAVSGSVSASKRGFEGKKRKGRKKRGLASLCVTGVGGKGGEDRGRGIRKGKASSRVGRKHRLEGKREKRHPLTSVEKEGGQAKTPNAPPGRGSKKRKKKRGKRALSPNPSFYRKEKEKNTGNH